MDSPENETLRWPTNLDRPAIEQRLAHIRALGWAQVHFHFVRVTGAQLNAFEFGFLAILNDCFDVPVFGEVVGNCPKLHPGRFHDEGFARGADGQQAEA